MIGFTGGIYTGPSTFAGWDSMTYWRDINISCGESTYTRRQLYDALNDNYLWNRWTFQNSTAEKLDRYIPNWQVIFAPSFSGPNFTGPSNQEPNLFLQIFGGLQDITDILLATNDPVLYVKVDDERYMYFTLSQTGDLLKTTNVKTTDRTYGSYGGYEGVSCYGLNTPKGSSWVGGSGGSQSIGAWQIEGGFPVKCSDGVTYLMLNVYSIGNGQITVRTSYTDTSSVRGDIGIYNLMQEGWKPKPVDTDPYSQGGNSGTGGGEGTFSDTGDIIGVPALPTLSAVDTGFISLFNPSASQVKALANYMWSQNFDLSLFKNIVANPIQCILGLSIVPVDPVNAGTKTLTVGNIATDVSMPYLASQYVEVDCGTLNIAEFWGSYLDYSPYTKIQLYLPYIGIVPVDIDDMQNSTIKVVYHVDVLSGACVAYVLCGGTQLYTYIGQCSSNIPVTSNDFTNTLNGILGIAGSIGSLVSSSTPTGKTGTVNTGGQISSIAGIASNAVDMFKPNIQKSGALSGTGGMLGVQTPYLICQRPRQSVPAYQNHFTGYPSNITYTLSDLTGYTEVQSVHLDNVPCTDAEMTEILEYLIGGVVI